MLRYSNDQIKDFLWQICQLLKDFYAATLISCESRQTQRRPKKQQPVTTRSGCTTSPRDITKHSRPERPVKDKEGNTVLGTQRQLHRWVEHFEELLNRPAPLNPLDIDPADTDLDIYCEKPTREEILKLPKNGKAAGPYNIPAEALKADLETTVEMLHTLFEKIREEKEMPADWKEGYLVKLPKKGDLSNCANYRGITLLPVPGKVFNRILQEGMKGAVDPLLQDQVTGFRQNRSCTDQIATLRIIS